MRIAVDAMGGDHAPNEIIKGAIGALEGLAPEDQIILVGDEAAISSYLKEAGVNDSRLVIEATTEVIGMKESPVEAVRTKTDSSIVRMAKMAGRKAVDPVDIIISAGNTGACVTAAQMFLRRLPGVHRPGIAVVLPTFGGPVVLCDVGANPDAKPHHLWQYGLMASVYAKEVLGVKNARIAQMNFGGEEAKGTESVRLTRDLFRNSPNVNYTGYIEGREIFDHAADVVVMDGFVGNVVIKLSEGLASGLFRTIVHEINEIDPSLGPKFAPIIKTIYARHDYHEYGGAPLLGINGTCIICHGSSEAKTISNAILRSRSMVSHGLNEEIVKTLKELEKAGVA